MTKLITDQDIGHGLHITSDNKLAANVDGSTLTIDPTGKIKVVPQAASPLADVFVNGGRVDGSQLTLTLSNGTSVVIDLSNLISGLPQPNITMESLGGVQLFKAHSV